MENVSPILAPDRDAMIEHLQLLFGRALQGRIEISSIRVTGEGERSFPDPHYFDVGDLEEAADYAAEVNRKPGHNVYVGAALRREDVFPGRTASDDDFLKTYALFADADTPEQRASARDEYRRLGITPPFIVVTGRTPHTRSQFWWPLEEPIENLQVARASLRGIASVLKTDPAVCTGKQLMRLAGGISWPKKADRVLERTEVVKLEHASRGFDLEQVHRAFPPSRALESVPLSDEVVVASGGALGLEQKIMDGRERYAFRLVRAHLHEWIGTTGSEPSVDDLYRSVAPVYLKRADQVRPGRGPAFLRQKCEAALRAFSDGQIPFMATLEEAVLSWAARDTQPVVAQGLDGGAEDVGNDIDAGAKTARDDLFEVLSIADIKALPEAEWIVHEAIPQGGLGFLYGAPGTYKSFICSDLALSLAYGKDSWIERAIKHCGSVLYIAAEGATGIRNRISAWQVKNGIDSDDGAFRLIRTSLSFMSGDDVDRLERTVGSIVAQSGDIATIFVDTVSRVLPGADENLQKDMTLFVAACDRLRERFGATVIGVHHTNKAGEMRGSTVFLGQGDFVMKVERDEGRKSGVLVCEKQKEAEDQWRVAFSMETQEWLPEGRIKPVSSLTVAWGGEPAPRESGDGWPSMSVCREIVKVIGDAWGRGKPWSPYPQTQAEGRYAPYNVARTFGVKSETVSMMITDWLANDVLTLDVFDKRSKQKGLKVQNGL
jgi:hypothetical protein